MAGVEFSDDEKTKLRTLHAGGLSLRAIAKELGRAVSSTQRVAAKLGLTFDREPTKVATAAKQADNRSRRAALVASLYDIAEDDVKYLRQGEAYDLTEVSAGQAVDYMVARLPAQDRRALLGAISTAAQTAVKLEQVDASEGAEGAKSMLGDLARGLRAVYLESTSPDHDESPTVG